MPFVTPADLQSTRIDYLIVGGGTASLTLAARLTEDPNVNVVVAEAGPCHDGAPEVDIPGFTGQGIANPKFDWMLFTTPQKYANNRAVLQPRGKGLGGSSFLNFTAMLRPSKREIDAIETLGNKGWNWDSILHYMKKSETLQLPDVSESERERYGIRPDMQYHGSDGPIKKSYVTQWYDIHGKMMDAVENFGVPKNSETGGGRNDGVMTSILTVDSKAAKRSYAYPEYLKPNLHRKNLIVLTDTHVTKITLEKQGTLQRATGIVAVRNDEVFHLSGVQREVIVCCGSYQTPQLLELSGIGNPAILSRFNIPTIIDLPGVGENLQDHIHIATTVEIDTPDEMIEDLVNPEVLKKHQELYGKQKGFLSSVPAIAFVFLPADVLGTAEEVASWKAQAKAECTQALSKTHPALKSGLEKQYEIQKAFLDTSEEAQGELIHFAGSAPVMYAPKAQPGKHYTSLLCSIAHPFSRGTCHISSADPTALPAANPNYYSNDADLDLHVRLVQAVLKIYKTNPIGAQVNEVVLPNKDIVDKGAEGIREFIKENCGTTYHPVGTASMMPREDGGVVDPSLKVYGTSNLRVVDASILPIELSTHIQSVVYAIGEKAADIIKAEYASA